MMFLLLSIMVVLATSIYFLPTIFAFANKKKNVSAILILNLLTGWTVIGWIIALVWGLCKD